MRLGSALPLSILALGLLACESPLSNSERRLLAEGQAKWAARGYGDYSIEMRRSCFCPPEINEWARVEVVAGTVSRVTLLQSGQTITDFRLSYWSSVEQLFSDLRETDEEDWLEDIEFTLDPVLGYPTEIRWISPDNVLDAGATQYLRNPAPLPSSSAAAGVPISFLPCESPLSSCWHAPPLRSGLRPRTAPPSPVSGSSRRAR